MTTDIIKDMVVAFPRDVRRELANRYGCIRVDQTVYALLMNCVEKGLVDVCHKLCTVFHPLTTLCSCMP